MQRIRGAAGLLQGAALLACLSGADAGSQGFISVSNGAFVDSNCTEFIPVGWNSCDLFLCFLSAALGVCRTLQRKINVILAEDRAG